MKVLVCGGRAYQNRERIFQALDEIHQATPIRLLAQGGAAGADALAKEWAKQMFVEVCTFYADWRREGRAAGPLRNQRMLDTLRPHLVIAFPGGRGTGDMVMRAEVAGVPVKRIS